MNRKLWVFIVFLSVAGLLSAKMFPPVVVSADLDTRRKGGEKTNTSPLRYALYVAPYDEFGSIAGGGQPRPSADVLASLVRAALPADRYTPVSRGSDSLDVVIAVHWGEMSPHGPQPFIQAREGGVVTPPWAVTVGRTHVPPFITSTQRSDLQAELSRDRYFLVISSYDVAALRSGEVSLHWQTRTSVDSLQVRMSEAWSYLASVAKANIERRLERPEFISASERLAPAPDSAPLIPIEQIIPGATKLLTFEKAMPPF